MMSGGKPFAASFVPAGIFTDEKKGICVGCWVRVQLEMSTSLAASACEGLEPAPEAASRPSSFQEETWPN